MEVLPLSLSRLQVLCHSLSKVLFKLSLTLLVRYRSSYSMFNLGRQIPAAWHCIPKQCYSLKVFNELLRFSAQWATTFYGSILTWKVGFSWVCFAELNLADPVTITKHRLCHNSRPLRSDSASGSVHLRSPLTDGITVVFFSSAE